MMVNIIFNIYVIKKLVIIRPPPTGDRCQDLRNRIKYFTQCADLREQWDKKFWDGSHDGHQQKISEARHRAKIYQKRLDNAWECREQCK